MSHPRLSINALSSFSWTFDQDLALWRELEVAYAALLISKIADDIPGKIRRVTEAGMGVTFVPDRLLAELAGFERIRAVNFGTIHRKVGLYYKKHRPLSEGAKRFVAICEEKFGADSS